MYAIAIDVDVVCNHWTRQRDFVFGDRCGYKRGRYGLTVIGRDSFAGGDDNNHNNHNHNYDDNTHNYDDNNHNGGSESSG